MDSLAQGSVEESLSALSTQLIAHGYLTRPLDLSTLFLPPPLPQPSSTTGEVSTKSLKKHQDLLILQARAREQLAKCMWGMLDKRVEEREVMEGLLAREARAGMEQERERGMRERAEREREAMGRELEAERARAKDAETKLKTEQERHRHAKDELSKTKNALQFIKTQALHDQKRRETEVTALHQRLQKATTSTDSSFTRFVVLNPQGSSGPSSSTPLSATFGGRTSRLSSGSSARSPTPTNAGSSSALSSALEAEVELLSSALAECQSARTHLEGENRQLREFVGEVGEWAEGVVEMEEFAKAKECEEGEELTAVLGGSGDGDESYMIPTPHLSLPIPALAAPLHRKLYAIRLALSALSTSTATRLSAQREELLTEVAELEVQLEEERAAVVAAKEEAEEMEKRAEEADRLVREFVEEKAEGRRKTMAREAESDDDSIPAELAAQLAAQKAARIAAKEAKKARAAPPPPTTAAPPPPSSTTAAPRPSEPPSASVAAFLSELGLDTPATTNEPLLGAAAGKARQARFEQVTGSVEKEKLRREKKAAQVGGEGGRASSSTSLSSTGERARRTSGSSASTRLPSSSSQPKPSSSSSSSSSSAAAASAPTTSSALSSILSLGTDSPPSTSEPLVSTNKNKVLKPSSAGNSSREKADDLDKVRAKKAALLERARAARA